MGPRQLQILAQKIRQVEARQHLRLDALTVDFERDGNLSRQADPPRFRSGRPSSADTHRASNTLARCRRIPGDACWSSWGSSSSPSIVDAADNVAGVMATPINLVAASARTGRS